MAQFYMAATEIVRVKRYNILDANRFQNGQIIFPLKLQSGDIRYYMNLVST